MEKHKARIDGAERMPAALHVYRSKNVHMKFDSIGVVPSISRLFSINIQIPEKPGQARWICIL
jgi:hypothetical protein